MGLFGLLGKGIALGVALVAIFVGAIFSGALKASGFFKYVDSFEGARGTFFKGMFPAMHEGQPWGFTLEQMPNLKGQTVLVTGANVGLGYWTAFHMATHDATLIIGCRSQAKCNAAAESIKKETGKTVETVLLDLASFASIRAAASSVASKHPVIDSLVLNAGVMLCPFGRTEEGLEMQIGTNHFGHQLLTKLLLPQVEAAAKAKGVATIVPVTSAAHYDSYAEGILPTLEMLNDESVYDSAKAYGQSKLANVLFAQELAERVKDKNILVNSVHPGGVDTDLARHVLDIIAKFSRSFADKFYATMALAMWHPRDAALTQIYAAVGPELKEKKVTGKYFHPIARRTVPDPHAKDEAMQKRLWKMTEDFIAAH